MKMKGNKTIILVTHQIFYMYGCDKVIIMEEGRVANFDVPEKLRDNLNELSQEETKAPANENK